MNLIKLLKQLKTIEPNRAYTERSRHFFVTQSAPSIRRTLTMKRFLWDTLQFGAGVAAVWILFVLILGGFSADFPRGGEFTSLRAEADAIDLQIQLVNLNYFEIAEQETSTVPIVSSLPVKTTPPAQSASSSRTLTIEEALEALEE